MPELPEVEFTARQLRASVVGATIRETFVFWERIVGHPGYEDLKTECVGRRIEGVRRRGKYLLLDLSENRLLTIHRRMSGNLLLLPPAWKIDNRARESDSLAWSTKGPTFLPPDGADSSYSRESMYCRLCFALDDGRKLLYTDPRKFGRIEFWARDQEVEALKGLGPEPLSAEFTVRGFTEALAGRKTGIKQLLLNQTIVAGVGNIYADEALFYAGIHPQRQASSLNADEIALLHKGIVAVLTLGIEHGGTSFSDYRDLWGEAGNNFNHVRVYQQDGKPCGRCGTLIERQVIAQRSAHFCPECQKLIAV